MNEAEIRTLPSSPPCPTAEQSNLHHLNSVSLKCLREQLRGVNVVRDLVPLLVARHVLQSHEMSCVYSKVNRLFTFIIL